MKNLLNQEIKKKILNLNELKKKLKKKTQLKNTFSHSWF